MITRPPRSTRPDTRFPYTRPFRSDRVLAGYHHAVACGGRLAVDRDRAGRGHQIGLAAGAEPVRDGLSGGDRGAEHRGVLVDRQGVVVRSEEHTSELQSLMRISYAVFCLKKKKHYTKETTNYI